MLELDVKGVKFDLQYCAAARIAVSWPAPLSLPATDPLFSLPLQTLSKLKAVRDLAHLLQTTPDLSAFRIAYRFLVAWANKLDGALERFSEQIRGNESFFDPALAWIDVKHVSRSKLEHLIVDSRDWGDNADLEDGLDFEDEDDEEEISDMSAQEDAEAQIPSVSEVKGKGRASTSKVTLPVSGRKLRPATDILNRLRWDPKLNSLDYVVGYTDRFLGTRETPLDRWKLEQTDEEFIPQHRILYFKRRSDGVKVWDREARIDALFGSGG
ncbi:Endonuclease/exonuclease/phosphatase [Neofusicoccum parvum]|uniref:Endonuclease/exonuclease/phosphatase n=1 Tax=Neofusicoccum parvum TaxID=310453 RepID=A0ACB5SEF6_9PEZI|nr:Endonuclease/exonuclease/phosphatase [Neofusicoccum parvum]